MIRGRKSSNGNSFCQDQYCFRDSERPVNNGFLYHGTIPDSGQRVAESKDGRRGGTLDLKLRRSTHEVRCDNDDGDGTGASNHAKDKESSVSDQTGRPGRESERRPQGGQDGNKTRWGEHRRTESVQGREVA